MKEQTALPQGVPERVIAYARVSTTGQETNTSLPSQLAAMRAYAKDQGWVIVDELSEIASGFAYYNGARPILESAVSRVVAGDAEIILVFALDRLSRSTSHAGYIRGEFEIAGRGRIESVSEDLAGPEGQIMRAIASAFAEHEREKTRKRTMKGRRERVETRKQWLPGRCAPYGLMYADDAKTRLVEDPETGPVLRRMFRDVDAGGSASGVARALTLEGVPTPSGKGTVWNRQTVLAILRNEVYTGRAVAYAGKVTKRQGQKRNGTFGTIKSYAPRDASDPVAPVELPEGTTPVLVTPETFARVAVRIANNKTEGKRNNRDPESFLLRSGFARCGLCGDAMIAGHHQSRDKQREYPHYRHNRTARNTSCPNHSISAADLDAAVWERIARVLADQSFFAQFVAERRASSDLPEKIAAVDAVLSGIAKRIGKLSAALAEFDDGEMPEIVAQLKTLKAQQKGAQRDRAVLVARQEAEGQQADDLGFLLEAVARVSEFVNGLNYAEKRSWLAALGVRVEVFPADHAPRWRMESVIDPSYWLPEPGEGGAAPVVNATTSKSVGVKTRTAVAALRWTPDDAFPALVA